uniref:DUF1403 family protein n=1 Tax=Panagrellus redivivus TaxID=6233 RepID=A0A7E4VAV1_PANRE
MGRAASPLLREPLAARFPPVPCPAALITNAVPKRPVRCLLEGFMTGRALGDHGLDRPTLSQLYLTLFARRLKECRIAIFGRGVFLTLGY